MKSVDLLKLESELAFAELLTTLEGVTQGRAWAVLPQGGPDYLHSDGSIQGIALHIASCKRMYGSVGFRDTEIRWRDCADEVARFEPNWPAALRYFNESHRYWLGTWADLSDEDLDRERPHFRGTLWPVWKIIARVIQHDSYHAGQIAVLRYAIGESAVPPSSAAEDIRSSCPDLPSW